MGQGIRQSAGGAGSGVDLSSNPGHAGLAHSTSAGHGWQRAGSGSGAYPSNRQLRALASFCKPQVITSRREEVDDGVIVGNNPLQTILVGGEVHSDHRLLVADLTV